MKICFEGNEFEAIPVAQSDSELFIISLALFKLFIAMHYIVQSPVRIERKLTIKTLSYQ